MDNKRAEETPVTPTERWYSCRWQLLLVAILILGFSLRFAIIRSGGYVATFRGEIPLSILFGWIAFIRTSLPQAHFDVVAISLSLGLGVVFALGFHWMMGWLIKHWGRPDEVASPQPRRQWRAKWTFCCCALVLLMFVAGIAATAVVHHIGWIASDVARQEFIKPYSD